MFAEFRINDVKALGEAWGVPDERQLAAFSQYYALARLIAAIPVPSLRILELGSGYSTALLAMMAGSAWRADGRDIRITSIDIDFSTFDRIPLEGDRDRVIRVRGSTVTADELMSLYGEPKHVSLLGRPLAYLMAQSPFAKTVIDERKLLWLRRCSGLESLPDIQNKMAHDPQFFRDVIDFYSNFGSFIREVDLVSDQPIALTAQLIDARWDVIFFDSGELSTNVEFMKLSRALSASWMVAFHDVWFPKSFKSWLPAAAIGRSPEWRSLYVDESTPQGLFVAERKSATVARSVPRVTAAP